MGVKTLSEQLLDLLVQQTRDNKTVSLAQGNQVSVDGRLRTGEQISLGDYKHLFDKNVLQFDEELSGATETSTYEGDTIGGVTMAVNNTGDYVIRQSIQWHNYFAGKPQKIELTSSNFQPETGVIKRFGYFSSSTTPPFNTVFDGIYFETSDTADKVYAVISRAGTELFREDNLNWANAETFKRLALKHFNFYVINFLYLGGADCLFSILVPNVGVVDFSRYIHVGVDNKVFLKSPNQPVRYEIRSTGGAGSFNHICSDVAVEGVQGETGVNRTVNMGGVSITGLAQNTRYALIAIRQKSTHRAAVMNFTKASILSTSTDNLLPELVYGGSIVGTPAWTNIANSGFQQALIGDAGGIANAVHTGGMAVESTYTAGNGDLTFNLESNRRLGNFIDGTPEVAYLCVTPLGTNAGCAGSLSFKEY